VLLCNAESEPLPSEIVKYTILVDEPIFGEHEVTRVGFNLKAWLTKVGAQAGDWLIATIVDWNTRFFQLELESASSRATHMDEIERKNKMMADILFSLLEAEREEGLVIGKAIPALYAQLTDAQGYPGDPWMLIVEQDPRMLCDSIMLRYAEWMSPFETFDALFAPDYSLSPEDPDLSEAEQQRVYRFKAALKYRKGLWRKIEIQGGQTLADFNRILVKAFKHDWDHLGGFWKRVRRGNSKRYREIELGDVDPFGDGSGADTLIATLELQIGDTLKYVFDFGDWIEHALTLEAIVEPEAEAEYPRIVAQNRVRHRYCQVCKEEGRKTVATWICITCSNDEARDVLICEDCLEKHHEDHYADEILY
jgi:hypothetical protein